MLKNTLPFIHTEAQLMINSFHESIFEFYLTGSHYFGNTHKQSDWDFFTNYSTDVVSFLLSKGFKKDEGAHYGDRLCMDVFTWKPTMPNDFFKEGLHDSVSETNEHFNNVNRCNVIQVQLVSDAALKETVQFFLKRTVDKSVFSNKETVTGIWNFGIGVAIAVLASKEAVLTS